MSSCSQPIIPVLRGKTALGWQISGYILKQVNLVLWSHNIVYICQLNAAFLSQGSMEILGSSRVCWGFLELWVMVDLDFLPTPSIDVRGKFFTGIHCVHLCTEQQFKRPRINGPSRVPLAFSVRGHYFFYKSGGRW